MFSITPSSGWPSFSTICAARSATRCAAGCGVVTSTASERGSSWPSESPTSPVPGRHVDQQVVERAPVDVGEELLERAMQHRPAPHTEPPSSRKNPIDMTLRSCATGGTIILSTDDRALLDAEHAGDRVAVDVGVDDADLEPAGAQREREVDRQRRLADAALAGRDGDDARALLDRDLPLVVAAAALQLRAQRGALRVVHVREPDGHGVDARHGADVHAHLRLEVRLERATGDREPDRHVHVRRRRRRPRRPCRARRRCAASRGRSPARARSGARRRRGCSREAC